MVSSAIKLISIGSIGVGGVGTALWVAGVFSDPYESKWQGKIEGLSGASLVCGKIKNKYDCKLSLSLNSVNSSSSGGGDEGKAIKITNIADILNSPSTVSTLYLFDKDTSNLWYIFKGQGPWIELKIFTNQGQGKELRPVVKTCRTIKSCAKSTSGCCSSTKQGKGHVGEKVDEKFEKKWNDLINGFSSSKPKKISYKNIAWKLSYL